MKSGGWPSAMEVNVPSTRRRVVLRHVIAFVMLAFAGAVVWLLSTPAVAVNFFGEAGYEAAYRSPVYGFLGLPLLALPPLVAGFALPKGFFLWGAAVALPYLPGAVVTYLMAGAEATFMTPDPGAGQVLGLVFVDVMMFLGLALVCTVAAGVGAGLRAIFWWRRGVLRRNLFGAGG